MSTYLNEDEQVEALKAWWKKYGTSAVVAIIIGVSGTFIFQYWQNNQTTSRGQASTIYQNILNETDKTDTKRQAKQAAYIKHHYPNTIYASMASLFLAKQAVAQNDLKTADSELEYAAKNADPKILSDLINLRRSRVLIAMQQNDAAMKLLDGINVSALKSAVENVRGDILMQQGKVAAAKSAYQTALQGSHDILQLEELVNLKLANITETSS